MKHRIVLWLFLVLLPINVWAQTVPIGVAAWQDTITGQISRAFGCGGQPTLNYQKADSTWGCIVDKWIQVGDRQIWRSEQGKHRVYADSTGAAIYAVGNHYLGTETTHLIKLKLGDSTWQTIRSALPDSITTEGNRITFHNIFPGVDKRLKNNAKIFRKYTEEFIFYQEARDSLVAWGPWSGYLFGTATRLNVDSLNLSWKDAAGIFGITNAGRMTDGWIKAMDSDTMVFAMASAYLRSLSDTGRMAVKKYLVLRSGVPYLIELFNPIKANQMFPTGTLVHAVQFGDHVIYGSSANLENKCYGGQGTTTSGGTMDSIVAYLYRTSTNGSQHLVSFALYEDVTTDAELYDSTARTAVSIGTGWVPLPVEIGYTVTGSTNYTIMMTAPIADGVHEMYYEDDITADDSREILNFWWSNEGWNDNDPAGISWADWGPVSIYGVYTEPAPEAPQIIIMSDASNFHRPRTAKIEWRER